MSINSSVVVVKSRGWDKKKKREEIGGRTVSVKRIVLVSTNSCTDVLWKKVEGFPGGPFGGVVRTLILNGSRK